MTNETQDIRQTGKTLLALVRDVKVAWRLWRDGAVPWWAKAIPLLSVGYLLFPMDLLADPMIGLGQLDDVAVLMLGLRLFIGACPPERVQWYRAGNAAPAKTSAASGTTIDGRYEVIADPWDESVGV